MDSELFKERLRIDGTLEVPGISDGGPLMHSVLRTDNERWVALVETEDQDGSLCAERIVELWNGARFGFPTAAELALQILDEIMTSPRLRACRNYSELHDHCDANMFECIERVVIDYDNQEMTDAFTDILNAAQNTVSALLSNGIFSGRKSDPPDEHKVTLAVVYNNDDEPKVYAPDSWSKWCSIEAYDKTDPVDPTGGAFATLLEHNSHPEFPNYRELA